MHLAKIEKWSEKSYYIKTFNKVKRDVIIKILENVSIGGKELNTLERSMATKQPWKRDQLETSQHIKQDAT